MSVEEELLANQPSTASLALAIRDEDKDAGGDSSVVAETKQKKIKLKHEDVHLQELPTCEAYEKSYMHRDVISHCQVTKTQFLVTASNDGVVKFWKKTATGIEFVKNFKSHAGPVEDISVTSSGSELASISRLDKSVKIFDIVNFDMINMFSLKFEPKCVEWITTAATSGENLVISDSQSSNIYTFDAKQSTNDAKRVLDKLHSVPICRMRWNHVFQVMISADVDGHVVYWRTSKEFGAKAKIQINQFEEQKIRVHSLTYSPSGESFATTSSDRKVRMFRFKTGEMLRLYDESLEKTQELQKQEPIMNSMDFARRMAIERELDRSSVISQERVIYDKSGTYILYPTMLGVKIYNWKTNKFIKFLGKQETNFRPLCIALFQGLVYEKLVRKFNLDALEAGVSDPTLYCCCHRKNRFYCFSNRYFEEDTTEGEGGELIKDRDIFNEKPTREEIMAAIEIEQQQQQQQQQTYENATIYTTMGDIHLRLFPKQAPKACENFCGHSKANYYNNHIFHRVINQFMIQTGDPTGTGTGGESIWANEFEDEFCDELTHEKPYTMSMANCGPNTNGSQFFITVAPCPFLDKKHTVFGRVVKGMDVCTSISKVKTDPKTDKPYSDIKIINIKVF